MYESQKLTNSTEVDKKPKRANSRSKNLKTEAQNTVSMRDSSWREFRTRWTKDSQLNRRLAEASSESGKCASGNTGENRGMSLSSDGSPMTTDTRQTILSSWISPTFVKSHERKDGEATKSARAKESHTSNTHKEASELQKDPSFADHHTLSQHRASPWVPRDKLPWLPEVKGDSTPGQEVGDQRTRSYQDYFHVRKWKREPMEQNHGLSKPILPEKQERSASVTTSERKKNQHSVYWLPEGLTKPVLANWSVLGELKAITSGASLKTAKTSVQEVGDQRIKSYQDYFAHTKCRKEDVEQTYGPAKQHVPENHDQGVDYLVEAKQQLLKKQKKMLRNLTERREEEIRKHRVQRRKLKKKEKEAKQRFVEAELLLSELKQERNAMDMEKRKLRRSWRALKREKKKFSYEREAHKTDKKALKQFTAVLKEEKQKLNKLKGKFRKKLKELFAKEKKVLKMEKKMAFDTKKEVQRLRGEIAQEKEKLQKQHRTLKSLKKAARKELKKWLGEVRKIKRKGKERRKAKEEKKRKQARKKWEQAEQERRRKTEYDAVVQEQVKYEKEKRRKKGEYGDTEEENTKKRERRKSDKNEEQKKGSEGKAKDFDREFSFRQQLEVIKQWLFDVHKKTLKQQQNYWSSLFARTKFDANGEEEQSGAKPWESHKRKLENFKQWLSSLQKKTIEKQKSYWGSLLGQTIFSIYGRQSERPVGKENNQQEQSEKIKRDSDEGKEDEKVAEGGEKAKETEWEKRKESSIEVVSGMKKIGRDQKGNEKKELSVRKSELTATSMDRALTGFVNLTFDADLVKALLKGLEKKEGKSNTANDKIEAADSTAFVILSEEPTGMDPSDGSDFKGKKSPKKPKIPEERQWQVPIKAEEPRWHQSSDPIPPEGFRLTPEEWYEKQFKKKNKGKKVVPQGPVLSEDEHRVRSGEESMRKQDVTERKVCTFNDPGEGEPIPPPDAPPDWVFRRARERAKDRADQRSLPWYEQRARDRYTQRSGDEHVTQFPCGMNWKQRFSPWYDRRAQDRSFQRSRDQHATQFPCGPNWKRRTNQRSNPWYDRRAQDRSFQRRSDKHTTQFPHGQKRKRSHNSDFERAHDQPSNRVPWYSRRAEDWESHRRESMDPWSSEYGQFRDHLRDWMPQGPSMDEPRGK